jgi:hypothetical protein
VGTTSSVQGKKARRFHAPHLPECIPHDDEPSGLTFAPPARLTIEVEDISDVDPARLKIAGASSSHDDWQVLGGTYDPDEGTVSIDVFHFSRYALCVE